MPTMQNLCVIVFLSIIHLCIVLFRLIFMHKNHRFIYVSWLKNSFLKQTNGDKLYMFLLPKGHLGQQTNTLLSDHIMVIAYFIKKKKYKQI